MADLNATSQASLDALLTKLGAKKQDPTKTSTAKSQLGQEDFLKLMTTQLQNQDPFQPQSNDQMIAQMAQFSTVSGITQLNSTMNNVATEISSNSIATLANIIGKTVLVPGNVAMPDDTGAISGAVDLASDATDLTVQITKPTGELVKSLSLGPNAAGLVGFQWDGTDSAGKPVGASSYKITAQMTSGGKQSAANTDVYAPITQLNVPAAGAEQTISVAGLGNLKMTDIRAYKY